MKLFWDLFAAFFRVGIMTFGGGYAMIPIVQREVVDKYGWINEEEMMDYYAMGQCTPGIIAANTAGFIGYKVKKTPGGIAAILGIVFPSFLIITAIAGVLSQFSDIPIVKSAFSGIRVCVCVLILNAILKLWKTGVKDKAALIMVILVVALSLLFDISPIIFVLLCAVAGVILTNTGVRGK